MNKLHNTIYTAIEDLNTNQYKQWIKEGGTPTKEKWILDKIKTNKKNELLAYLDKNYDLL